MMEKEQKVRERIEHEAAEMYTSVLAARDRDEAAIHDLAREYRVLCDSLDVEGIRSQGRYFPNEDRSLALTSFMTITVGRFKDEQQARRDSEGF